MPGKIFAGCRALQRTACAAAAHLAQQLRGQLQAQERKPGVAERLLAVSRHLPFVRAHPGLQNSMFHKSDL